LGNEEALQMLGAPEGSSQRRPLRQVIVKPMEYPLFGHGVVNNPKPRVTVTSHTLATGGYAWYLGGAIAEDTASMSDAEALAYARKEMEDMFPRVDWSHKEWATWYGVRAEARDPLGALAAGPVVQEYGNVLVAWPTKLTFTPILADNVLALIEARHIAPRYTDAPPALPVPALGKQPFEDAVWT
jgi:hypothetical protein